MRIYGELSLSAAQPSSTANDLSSRTKTASFVDWSPEHSTQTHVLLYTPDLSTIVTEIVSQAGWASGSPMGFLIEHVSGTGSRWVESRYTNSDYAALTGGSGVVPALEVRGSVMSLYHISYVAEADSCESSPYEGQIVTTQGFISAVLYNGFYMQQDLTGTPWGGIWVYFPSVEGASDQLATLAVGDLVEVTAEIMEYFGLTELIGPDNTLPTVTVLKTGHTLVPLALQTSDLGTSCTWAGEQWEGLLVTLSNVQLMSEPNSYGEITIDDGSGATQLEDGIMDHTHITSLVGGGTLTGNVIESITGVVRFAYGSFEIHPRTEADIVVATANPCDVSLYAGMTTEAEFCQVFFDQFGFTCETAAALGTWGDNCAGDHPFGAQHNSATLATCPQCEVPPLPPLLVASVEGRPNSGEEDANTGAMYLTSSDLEIPFDGTTRQLVGIVFPSVALDATSTCLTEAGCSARAQTLGLSLGGNGYAFAGSYSTKGCYSYSSGSYEGMAFFGTGGTEAQMATALTGSKYRPLCEIANTHLVFDVDELKDASAEDVTVRIYGELSLSAAQPSSTANDLSSRTKTASFVDWSPEHSTQTHVLLYTPDLSTIVTEIVSQAGWASGSPMGFLIEHVSGTGSRWVESYYTNAEFAELSHGDGKLPALVVRGPMIWDGPTMGLCAAPVGGDVTHLENPTTAHFTYVRDSPTTTDCTWMATEQGLYQASNSWGNYDPNGGGWNVLIGCNAVYDQKHFTDFIMEVEIDSQDNDGKGFVFGWNGIDDHYQAILMNDASPNPAADGVGGPFLKITRRSGACSENMDETNSCQTTLSYLNNDFASTHDLRNPDRMPAFTSGTNFNHPSGTIGSWPHPLPEPYAQTYPYERGTNFDPKFTVTLFVKDGEARLLFYKDGQVHPAATAARCHSSRSSNSLVKLSHDLPCSRSPSPPKHRCLTTMPGATLVCSRTLTRCDASICTETTATATMNPTSTALATARIGTMTPPLCRPSTRTSR